MRTGLGIFKNNVVYLSNQDI